MTVIGLIHTTRLVIEPVHNAIVAGCPDAAVFHILDEGVLRRLDPSGVISGPVTRRLEEMAAAAEAGGAHMAVISCSSLSRAVKKVGEKTSIPLIQIDAPMVKWAVNHARRIGLVMTNPSTARPSTELIREIAARENRQVEVVPEICPSAFRQLSQGDPAGHDQTLIQAVERLAPNVDRVLLAQISMARIRGRLPAELAGKVHSSLDFIAEAIRAESGKS